MHISSSAAIQFLFLVVLKINNIRHFESSFDKNIEKICSHNIFFQGENFVDGIETEQNDDGLTEYNIYTGSSRFLCSPHLPLGDLNEFFIIYFQANSVLRLMARVC